MIPVLAIPRSKGSLTNARKPHRIPHKRTNTSQTHAYLTNARIPHQIHLLYEILRATVPTDLVPNVVAEHKAASGVADAALHEKLSALSNENAALSNENAALRAELAAQSKRAAVLCTPAGSGAHASRALAAAREDGSRALG